LLGTTLRNIKVHFIPFVTSQEASTTFYSSVLEEAPVLNVAGMTEFRLAQGTILGLMPEDGIARLLGGSIRHPSMARKTPRSELYLMVEDAGAFHSRAIAAGARELSPLALRDWGHTVAYSLDPDGHLLAFANLVGRD
jgi:catechol 2,3-dioxygenase-like lactoylglutathione lyase family enzyme